MVCQRDAHVARDRALEPRRLAGGGGRLSAQIGFRAPLAIEDRQLNSYDGGWAEYVRRREELRTPARVPADPKPTKEKKAAPKAKP